MRTIKINKVALKSLSKDFEDVLPSEGTLPISVNLDFRSYTDRLFCQLSIIEIIQELCLYPDNLKDRSIDIHNALRIVNALSPVREMEFLDRLLIEGDMNRNAEFVDINTISG